MPRRKEKKEGSDVMRTAVVFLKTQKFDEAINLFDGAVSSLSPIVATSLLNLFLEYLDYTRCVPVIEKFSSVHPEAANEATYSKLIQKICEHTPSQTSTEDILSQKDTIIQAKSILDKMISFGIVPHTRSISPIIKKIVELEIKKSQESSMQDLSYLLDISQKFKLILTKADFAYLMGFAIRRRGEQGDVSEVMLMRLLSIITETYLEIDQDFSRIVSSILDASSQDEVQVGKFGKEMKLVYLEYNQKNFLLSNLERLMTEKSKGKKDFGKFMNFLEKNEFGCANSFDVVIDGGNVGLYGGVKELEYSRIGKIFANLVKSKKINKKKILLVLNARHKSLERHIVGAINKSLNLGESSFDPFIYWSQRGVNDDLYILYTAIYNCNSLHGKAKITKIVSNDKFQDHQYLAGFPLFFKRWIADCVVGHTDGKMSRYNSYSRCIQFIIHPLEDGELSSKMDIYFPIEGSFDICKISTQIRPDS